MSSFCEHCVEGENDDFIFDDENSWTKKCVKCRQDEQWPKNVYRTSRVGDNRILEVNGLGMITPGTMDDHIDTHEDAPLLINDCKEISADAFHCHNAVVKHEDNRAWKKLFTASLLCFFFMIAELVGGYIAGSLAVMTDAAHLFSDFIGFLISLLSIWIARKPPNKDMTFGYHRAEVLGAFLSVLTVWLLAAIFAVLAINRILKNEYNIDANTMMLVASLGLVVNLVMGAVLHGFCHNHSHGLNEVGRHNENTNINVRAAAAHVLGDLLQSCGVVIAAIVIKVYPGAQLADPICTLIFSLVVICTTTTVVRDSIWLLLEGSPKHTRELTLELQALSNVRHVHNLHIWTLSPGKHIASVHISTDKYCDKDAVLEKATTLIRSKLSVISCTVQVETYNEETFHSCKSCQSHHC